MGLKKRLRNSPAIKETPWTSQSAHGYFTAPQAPAFFPHHFTVSLFRLWRLFGALFSVGQAFLGFMLILCGSFSVKSIK